MSQELLNLPLEPDRPPMAPGHCQSSTSAGGKRSLADAAPAGPGSQAVADELSQNSARPGAGAEAAG